MRKLAVVLFAVGSLFLMAFPAYAEKGDMAFGVNGGMAMPMGCLADEDEADMKMGPEFGIGFDYFITKDLALGLDGSYVIMTSNESDDLKAKTMQFGVHGKYFIPTGGQFMPYLNLGVGMYNRKIELSGEVIGSNDVVSGTAGHQLVQEPQALLRKRERQISFTRNRNEWRNVLTQFLPFEFLNGLGQSGDLRRFKQTA